MASKKSAVHYHHPDHILIALACVIVLAVLIGYMMGKSTPPPQVSGPIPTPPMMYEQNEQVCQLDAMVCPDGTTLGRTGPNCTFPACP